MRIGVWEILIIVLLVVILFGSAKIPGMMRNLASGIKTFKNEMKDTPDEKRAARSAQKKSAVKKSRKKPVTKK